MTKWEDIQMTTIQEYAQNVDQLLALLRGVINQLITEDNKEEKRAMETQLREIARAIENLEKKNIFIPEVLRAEKTRLASAVEIQSEAFLSLTHLTEGLEEIILEFKPYLEGETTTSTRKGTSSPRSRAPKTDNKILRKLIIEALQCSGGSAPKSEVHKYIEDSLKGKFLPRDLDWRESTGNYVWQNNTDWERYSMTKDGILKKGSPIGIWELTEEYQ